MVTFYDLKAQVPESIECVDDNKDFFLRYTLQIIDGSSSRLLTHVDNCKYVSKTMYKSRAGFDLPWYSLSTGGMTILNAYYYPDKAFSCVECGLNALRDATLLPHGVFYDGAPNPEPEDVFHAKYRDVVYTDFERYFNHED